MDPRVFQTGSEAPGSLTGEAQAPLHPVPLRLLDALPLIFPLKRRARARQWWDLERCWVSLIPSFPYADGGVGGVLVRGQKATPGILSLWPAQEDGALSGLSDVLWTLVHKIY